MPSTSFILSKSSIKEETSEPEDQNDIINGDLSTGSTSPIISSRRDSIKLSQSNGTHAPNGTTPQNGTVANGTTASNGTGISNGDAMANGKPEENGKIKRAISNESIAHQVTKIFHEALREPRYNWGLQFEFIASCLGLSIGFSNFWRFPHLIYTYGGVAFIFCYILLFCLIGLPLYYLEAAMGQFAQLGCLHVWRCAPLMQGVGIGMIVLSLITSIYNSQITAYAAHYFFSSFINMEGNVMWGECKESWDSCYDASSNDICTFQNYSFPDPYQCITRLQSSSKFYWEERVLRIMDLGEAGKTGTIHWDLALCLFFVWMCVFFVLLKGTKSSGKAALFTGIIPICLLLAFLIASLRKPGALEGLQHFYDPNWEKLADVEVWQAAAQQVIFSLGITYGSIFMLGSYNRFKNKVHINVFVIWFLQLCISIMAATTCFAFYGVLANKLGITRFESLVNFKVSPMEILFTLYPEVIMRALPQPHAWSVFFYLMLVCIGIHSQYTLIETCLTTTYDALPRTRSKKFAVTLGLVVPLFLIGLPLCGATGFHIHHLLESAVVGPSVLLLAFIELVSLNYVYGIRRISRDIKMILGSQPSIFWRVMWIFVSPLSILILFVLAAIDWKRLLYENRDIDREWALYLTWTLTLLPIAMIPLTFVFTFIYKLCVKESLLQPSPTWGPGVADEHIFIINKKLSPSPPPSEQSKETTIVASD